MDDTSIRSAPGAFKLFYCKVCKEPKYKHLYDDTLRTCSEECARKLNDSVWRYQNMPKERENQKKWRRNATKRAKENHMRILTVQIPEEYSDVMDELVKLGKFKNKSVFTQKAISKYLWDVEEKTGDMSKKIFAGDERCKSQG